MNNLKHRCCYSMIDQNKKTAHVNMIKSNQAGDTENDQIVEMIKVFQPSFERFLNFLSNKIFETVCLVKNIVCVERSGGWYEFYCTFCFCCVSACFVSLQ